MTKGIDLTPLINVLTALQSDLRAFQQPPAESSPIGENERAAAIRLWERACDELAYYHQSKEVDTDNAIALADLLSEFMDLVPLDLVPADVRTGGYLIWANMRRADKEWTEHFLCLFKPTQDQIEAYLTYSDELTIVKSWGANAVTKSDMDTLLRLNVVTMLEADALPDGE